MEEQLTIYEKWRADSEQGVTVKPPKKTGKKPQGKGGGSTPR